MSDRDVDILLIGGGIASASAAAELRAGGFGGSIVLVTREQDAPYHRPPITKGYLQGREERLSALIHPESWYADNDVELLTRTPVMSLDTEARTAKLGREVVGFGQALVATGAMVRRLRCEGAQREGIHYLRALGNADTLREDVAQAERVAVVGGSYIATEVAASLTLLGKRCTLVMQEQLPTERGFGPVVVEFVRDLLSSHAIEIVGGADCVEFAGEGEEGRVEAVVCEDGRRVDADLVVVGVGATPDVMLARKAGLELGETGGVACDSGLRTSVEGIFAAGDMCEYDSVIHGRRLRIEHWDVALNHGSYVGREWAGAEQGAYDVVPYFFSDLADWTWMEYVGPAGHDDTVEVRGSMSDDDFVAYYSDADGRVTGCLGVNRSDEVNEAKELLAKGAGAPS
jgi:3-phenylpropionate/trans-cinnamate dioxygenase ferredoxin reductase component